MLFLRTTAAASRLRHLLRLAGMALAAMLALPATARAHTHLLRSTPTAGSTVAAAPTAIHLVFSERPELRFTSVRLLGPDGKDVEVSVPAMAIEGSEAGILVSIRGPMAPGRYTVEWQTASADGHAVKGRFRFTLTAGSAPPPAVPSAAPPVPPMDSANPMGGMSHEQHMEEVAERGTVVEQPFGFRVARWIEFIALLTLVGAVAFRAFVVPKVHDLPAIAVDALRRSRALGLAAGFALVLAMFARLYGESLVMHGARQALDPAMLGGMMTETRWGIGWMVGLIGALLAILGVAQRPSSASTALAGGGAVLACISPALTGHALATEGALAIPAVLFDVVHVTAAATWLGTLTAMAVAGIPAALKTERATRDAAVARLFGAFHPIALWCVGAVLLSGLGSSWIRLGSIAQLTMSNYGSVLLFKIYAFVFVGLIGAYNWKKVLPRLGRVEGTERIRTSVKVELVVGLVVLALTALLVITNPPR